MNEQKIKFLEQTLEENNQKFKEYKL